MTAPTGTPTPPQYTTGWVKQDVGQTMAVAIRTTIVTANNLKDWLVATVDHGGRYTGWDEVVSWADLPPPPVQPVAFAGEGTLSATAGMPGAFTGEGTLSATAEQLVVAAFDSEGTLSATAAQVVAAVLDGEGTLSAIVTGG